MLRITHSASAASAVRYFDEGLAKADYYAEGEREIGFWGGKGADHLKLGSIVTRKEFRALVNGQAPEGHRLTARIDADRRPGYDFTFSVPKSISVYLGETGDKEMECLIKEALLETLAHMETEMKTRVRKSGSDCDRITANMMWAVFTHRVTRPINGMPDPHFHMHAYVPNLTFDVVEKRWKAGQFGDLKSDAPYWEACFNSRLAHKLYANGYGIRRTERGFELSAVSQVTIGKFSKRTRQIEEIARRDAQLLSIRARTLMKEKPGISYRDALAEAKGQLGAQSRDPKRKGASFEMLRNHWRSQMNEDELANLHAAKSHPCDNLLLPKEAVASAMMHTFERFSVATERELATAALKCGFGMLNVETAIESFCDPSLVRREQNGGIWCTTQEVLNEERRLVDLVRVGIGSLPPLNLGRSWKIQDLALSEEQCDTVIHVLGSPDRFIGVRGAAGIGKPMMMREAIAGIKVTSGKTVFTFAPSSAAVDVLRADGFEGTQTVSQLLVDEPLQSKIKGQVIWVDEAGLLSVRQMYALVLFAEKNDCRGIFSGDIGQHRAIKRGDSLRLLEAQAGLRVSQLTEIQRQKAAAYKAVVADLREGRTSDGLQKLDAIEALVEIAGHRNRIKQLVDDHLAALSEGRTSLIIASNHQDGCEVTLLVRSALREKRLLEEKEVPFTRLENLGWTTVQRSDARNYRSGQILEFHQNTPGFRRGEKWTVTGQEHDGVRIEKQGRSALLPVQAADRFAVFEAAEISLSVGDTIRITKNVMSADGRHRFANGVLHKVTGIEENNISLENGHQLQDEMLHLDYGQVVSSHVSQGKTVDQVLISQPSATFSPASCEQLYMSVSRGRNRVKVFTDSKALLQEAIARIEMQHAALKFP
ncbi:MAG: MobF family relaxase [Verrucomicrobiota bacterium]